MKKNILCMFFFATLFVCHSCVSNSVVIDFFPPSVYSSERCDVVDTIEASIDSIYLIEIVFRRLYGNIEQCDPRRYANDVFYEACGKSLSEEWRNGTDSSYTLKVDSIIDIVGTFAIKNTSINKYVELLTISSDTNTSIQTQSCLLKVLYPELMKYFTNYKKEAESFTILMSSNYYHAGWIVSPNRTLIVMPKEKTAICPELIKKNP